MSSTKLNHTTAMINFVTGKEMLNPKTDELKDCGITSVIATGDPLIDAKLQKKYEEQILANTDRLSKYTLGDALNQLFDLIKIPSNSDFAVYADTLKNIRIAKHDNQDSIEITKEDLEKLTKIFKADPEKSDLNRLIAFVLECLDNTYADILKPQS